MAFFFQLAYTLMLFLVLSTPLQAGEIQEQHFSSHLRFEQLTTDDGLSYPNVYHIFQDSRGFMWFSTKYGLNRYDGMAFTLYTHEPDNPNSLSHNTVTMMVKDKQGFLWIGTYGGGLNSLDLSVSTDAPEAQHYFHQEDNANSLSHSRIRSIYRDNISVVLEHRVQDLAGFGNLPGLSHN